MFESSLSDWSKEEYITATLFFLFIGFCMATFFCISKFIGSADQWERVQDQTASIWAMSLVGSLALFIAAWFYFKIGDNSIKMIYFIFTVIFIAFGISYSALSISVINKNTAS